LITLIVYKQKGSVCHFAEFVSLSAEFVVNSNENVY